MAAPTQPIPSPANPQPIQLPAQPNDPRVPLPAAPAVPPTVNDVLSALQYRRNVDISIAGRPPTVRCTPDDRYNAVLYEHGVVAQAAVAANPQDTAPPWFQDAIQQLRVDLRDDMRDILRAGLRDDMRDILRAGLRDDIRDIPRAGLRGDIRDDIRDIIRAEILPDLKRLVNDSELNLGEGVVLPLEAVPFANDNDPTQTPESLSAMN